MSRYDAADAGRVTDHLRSEASLSRQIESLVAVYERCVKAHAAVGTGAAREAQLTARFMEDWLPSFASDRPWKTLATELLGAEADITSPMIARMRDAFFQRLSEGLDRLSPETTGRAASLAFRTWSLPARAFNAQAGGLEGDRIVVPMAGHTGNAIYGPYETRRKGRYEATFDLLIDEGSGGGTVCLDVAVGAQTIAVREIAARDFVDGEPMSLRFELPEDSAAIEYRAALTGFDAGQLRFGGVTLIREADSQAATNPAVH